jgi:hypothetical protein
MKANLLESVFSVAEHALSFAEGCLCGEMVSCS